MHLTCHITKNYSSWGLSQSEITHILEQVLKEFDQLKGYDLHLDITLSDDHEMQVINREHRGKDKPTNVLSFPQYESLDELSQTAPNLLGDIILSYQTIENEALAQGKSFEDHCAHLLVHGCLHLLGFDHMEPFDAEKMESLEVQILSRLGINNPYSEELI